MRKAVREECAAQITCLHHWRQKSEVRNPKPETVVSPAPLRDGPRQVAVARAACECGHSLANRFGLRRSDFGFPALDWPRQ